MGALKYIVVGAAVLLGGKYLLSLKRAKDNILTSVSGDRGKIGIDGIDLLIKYNIKNPTKVEVAVKPPLIKLSFNGKLIASSAMKSVDIPEGIKDEAGNIRIKAFSETGDIVSTVPISWMNLLSISPDLVTKLQNKDTKLTIGVETITRVYTAVGSYPLDDITKIEL